MGLRLVCVLWKVRMWWGGIRRNEVTASCPSGSLLLPTMPIPLVRKDESSGPGVKWDMLDIFTGDLLPVCLALDFVSSKMK